MTDDAEKLPTPCQSVYPAKPTPGSLGILVPEDRVKELEELQAEASKRIWEVRGVVSDHVALSGLGALVRKPQHRFFLNESPLSIYLHHGGRDAVYFDLVGDNPEKRLEYVAVRVRTKLPSNAFLLARRPLTALLDVCANSLQMPLLYQRLDLMSPRDGGLLAHEVILPPKPDGVRLGPLGGFFQAPPFAAYDAILREAQVNPSPYYQLLCACRLYEGTNWIRRWLRNASKKLGVDASLPQDTRIESGELEKMGLPANLAEGITKANELFRSMSDTRNAIAHFLLEGDQGEAHVYLADGAAFQHYSIGAAILLRYARQALDDLRVFYKKHIEVHQMAGSILPTPERRDQFIVEDPEARD